MISKDFPKIFQKFSKIFQRFKEKEKHVNIIKKFKVNKSRMIFKINKYLKLMKSSVTLHFLKTYFKDIKEICAENSSKFK